MFFIFFFISRKKEIRFSGSKFQSADTDCIFVHKLERNKETQRGEICLMEEIRYREFCISYYWNHNPLTSIISNRKKEHEAGGGRRLQAGRRGGLPGSIWITIWAVFPWSLPADYSANLGWCNISPALDKIRKHKLGHVERSQIHGQAKSYWTTKGKLSRSYSYDSLLLADFSREDSIVNRLNDHLFDFFVASEVQLLFDLVIANDLLKKIKKLND